MRVEDVAISCMIFRSSIWLFTQGSSGDFPLFFFFFLICNRLRVNRAGHSDLSGMRPCARLCTWSFALYIHRFHVGHIDNFPARRVDAKIQAAEPNPNTLFGSSPVRLRTQHTLYNHRTSSLTPPIPHCTDVVHLPPRPRPPRRSDQAQTRNERGRVRPLLGRGARPAVYFAGHRQEESREIRTGGSTCVPAIHYLDGRRMTS
jgi:hypothetical protein